MFSYGDAPSSLSNQAAYIADRMADRLQPLCDGAAPTSEEQAYLQGGQRDVLARAGQAVVLLLLYGRGGTAPTAGGTDETGEGDCTEGGEWPCRER